MLPKRYGRGYPEESEHLILGLLASSRSIEAVRRLLRLMGVSVPKSELQAFVDTLSQELKLLNIEPLDTDYLAVFMDTKQVEIRKGERLVVCLNPLQQAARRRMREDLLCSTERELGQDRPSDPAGPQPAAWRGRDRPTRRSGAPALQYDKALPDRDRRGEFPVRTQPRPLSMAPTWCARPSGRRITVLPRPCGPTGASRASTAPSAL